MQPCTGVQCDLCVQWLIASSLSYDCHGLIGAVAFSLPAASDPPVFIPSKTTCGAGFDILDIMSNLHRECGTRKNDYLCTELFELKLLFRFLYFMNAGIPPGVPACIKKALLLESSGKGG